MQKHIKTDTTVTTPRPDADSGHLTAVKIIRIVVQWSEVVVKSLELLFYFGRQLVYDGELVSKLMAIVDDVHDQFLLLTKGPSNQPQGCRWPT